MKYILLFSLFMLTQLCHSNESLAETYDKRIGNRFLRQSKLTGQLEKIEKEFPALNIINDSLLLSKLYSYDLRDADLGPGPYLVDGNGILLSGKRFVLDELLFRSPEFPTTVELSDKSLGKEKRASRIGTIMMIGGSSLAAVGLVAALPAVMSQSDDIPGITPILAVTGAVVAVTGFTIKLVSIPIYYKKATAKTVDVRDGAAGRNRLLFLEHFEL